MARIFVERVGTLRDQGLIKAWGISYLYEIIKKDCPCKGWGEKTALYERMKNDQVSAKYC
jgi:hypothetical protein